jgi:hypothetical protein
MVGEHGFEAMVGEVIRATPGVDDVRYKYLEQERVFSLSGAKDQVYAFSYKGGSNVRGGLTFTVEPNQSVEFQQSLTCIGGPSQASIDATRPVMIRIEEALAESCGLTNLRTSVVERRSGGPSE